MPIKRQVMKFIIPTSVFGIGSETLAGRKTIPLYISPESLSVRETKKIRETFTKGGYMVEYWGEELPQITCRGTTGSGGIEAVEILRSIYRNEQIQMERLLARRARNQEDIAQNQLEDTSSSSSLGGLVSGLDALFENAISEISDGTKSIVEQFTEIFDGDSDEDPEPVELIPSLGAFAVSVDLYMQGHKYRGYFTNFTVTETSSELGIFTYDFVFKVLRRTGKRLNSMPWHRSPVDAAGNPVEASIPIEGARVDELSYGTNPDNYGGVVLTEGFSTFTTPQIQDQIPEINNVGVSRINKVKG